MGKSSVAFEIRFGRTWKRNGEYRPAFITIWHCDHNCDWFGGRDLDPTVLKTIVNCFRNEWDGTYGSIRNTEKGPMQIYCNTGWFGKNGYPILSISGIVSAMFLQTCKIVLDPEKKGFAWNKAFAFMNKYHAEIMHFAENNIDSLFDVLVKRELDVIVPAYSTSKQKEELISHCAVVVYSWILRKQRPWYKHPRWHIRHWEVQWTWWQNLRRRYWDKCCICGKRGFRGETAFSNGGGKIWHQKCDAEVCSNDRS